ncbi:MAG: FeoB-associated Cys-rich membrane protein [Gammaproteobacteria bacterium]|jgi:hypothetical protein|nr:FeoB-associated Cys-rich membrane protein [Gammaproteobacteria bacterium]
MDDALQQVIALLLVAVIVAFEFVRRARKNKSGKVGCDSCDSGEGGTTDDKGEAPVKFYKRKNR